MTIEQLSEVLLWCFVINMGLLMWWAGFFILAHDFVYNLHTKWFKISVERFDAIHYAGMAIYKIGMFMFFLVPWMAMKIVI